MNEERVVDIDPQMKTYEPIEARYVFRLKRARFLSLRPDGLHARLSRASLYLIKRLHRRYPYMGATPPRWLVDDAHGKAYCSFGYIDVSDIVEEGAEPILIALQDQVQEVSIPQRQNRAQRRAAR